MRRLRSMYPEEIVIHVLAAVLGKPDNGEIPISLTGDFLEDGDAVAYHNVPSLVSQSFAGKFAARLKWRGEEWWFSENRAFKNDLEITDAHEVRKVLRAWLEWLNIKIMQDTQAPEIPWMLEDIRQMLAESQTAH